MSEEQGNSDAAGKAAVPAELDGVPAGDSPGRTSSGGRIDLDMLMDVEVELAVEIGRVDMSIGKLLALSEGSIVALARGVAEPMDLMVNGKLIARGEVVESSGHFGLRLLEVVSPTERLSKLE